MGTALENTLPPGTCGSNGAPPGKSLFLKYSGEYFGLEGHGGVSVAGTLQGYFLTPQGQFGPRTFTLVERPGKARESVHPVPSAYYLSIVAKSTTAPIARAEVLTLRNRHPLLSVRMDAPAAEVRLPRGEAAWLGVRPEEGLAFRVVLHLVDGQRVDARIQPDGSACCACLPCA
mgnify:FL=1